MKVGAVLKLTINSIGSDGDGIADWNGTKIYVSNAFVGDKIFAKIVSKSKTYSRAEILKIAVPSPFRVKYRCNFVRQCGGCQIQELDYSEQLKLKKSFVEKSFEKVGLKDLKVNDVVSSKKLNRFRNKALYPISRDKNGKVVAGFYSRNSHKIIDLRDCPVECDENALIVETIVQHIERYDIEPYDEINNIGVVRHILIRKSFTTNQIMVCLVLNSLEFKEINKLVETLVFRNKNIKSITINVNKTIHNNILGSELISVYGENFIEDIIGKIKYRISPLSFYQINAFQTKILYDKVVEFADLNGEQTVFDLYCGVGTISLYLALKSKKVYGVEIVESAVENARLNAKLNNIFNVDFYLGSADEVVENMINTQNLKSDVVVVDPPRKGCGKDLLTTIVKMKPQRIVYVSCNCDSLAVDLKFLVENGFVVKAVQPVDMFPHTIHIENVVRLDFVL